MSRLFKFTKENLGVSAEQLLQNPGMNELDIFMSGLDTNGDSFEIGQRVRANSIKQGTIIYVSINGKIRYRFESIDGDQPKKINGKTMMDVRNIEKLYIPVRINNVPGISKGQSWPFLNIDQISYIEEQQQHNMDIDASQGGELSDEESQGDAISDEESQGDAISDEESQGDTLSTNAILTNAISTNAISTNAILTNAISTNEFQGNNPMIYMAERICFQLGIEDCSYVELIYHAKVILGIHNEPIFTNVQSNIRAKITYIYNQIV